MEINFKKLIKPTQEIAATFNKWATDPYLRPRIRPNHTKEELEKPGSVTVDLLSRHLDDHITFLIFADAHLVGEMNYHIDPDYLFKTDAGSAWIGIVIGEESARGKGIGEQAISFLECKIKAQGLKRIELGVFEFNTNAIKLYQKLGFQEIGRIENFTYWDGRMWCDIRMEKCFE